MLFGNEFRRRRIRTRVVKSGEVSEAGALRNAAVPVKKEKGLVKRRKAKASFMLLIYMKDAFVFFIREKGEKIMGTVSEYFGSLVFDDRVMKATLSKEV